jgi:hypothetical protein
MKVASVAMVCFALIGPALAQEQTVKACRAEWQAVWSRNRNCREHEELRAGSIAMPGAFRYIFGAMNDALRGVGTRGA